MVAGHKCDSDGEQHDKPAQFSKDKERCYRNSEKCNIEMGSRPPFVGITISHC